MWWIIFNVITISELCTLSCNSWLVKEMGRHQSIETELRSDCSWLIDCTRLCQSSFWHLLFSLMMSYGFDIRFYSIPRKQRCVSMIWKWFISNPSYCNALELSKNILIQKDLFLTLCLLLIIWQGMLKTLWVEGICWSIL